jgi:diadenylate cyclase
VAEESTAESEEALLRATLASVAPGTALREGLERIVRGRTGALVVLGHDKHVESVCSGGFALDVPFTATGLRELAKMDGAIVVDLRTQRIVRAATQLVPDAAVPTQESGTRHRTAERTAKQTGHPVISVSQSMNVVAIYVGHLRRVLETSAEILVRANQALATLERYKYRLDEVTGTLSALEVEDLATVRDIAVVAQRMEMVRRIAEEIAGYVLELGADGRLLSLQLDELVAGVEPDRRLLVRDYAVVGDRDDLDVVEGCLVALEELDATELLDPIAIAAVLGHAPRSGEPDLLERPASPRGHRLLARVPRLPGPVVQRLIDHFGGLPALLSASLDDLLAVEGVGEARARNVREALSRLAESSILDRYV